MDIGFAHNYTNLYEIYEPTEERWLRIAAGITSVSWEGNEESAQDAYYDGNGFKDTEITGGQIIGSFEGHRRYGDAAQEYIASLLLDYMSRKTKFRWTQPDGSQLIGDVTVANIVPQGGEAGEKSEFSFEIHFNGLPQYVSADENLAPTSVTVDDIEVKVGGADKLMVSLEPLGCSQTVFYSVDDTDIAEVDSDGTVHGVAEGETEVVVRSAVLPTVYGTATITVVAVQDDEEGEGSGDEDL